MVIVDRFIVDTDMLILPELESVQCREEFAVATLYTEPIRIDDNGGSSLARSTARIGAGRPTRLMSCSSRRSVCPSCITIRRIRRWRKSTPGLPMPTI